QRQPLPGPLGSGEHPAQGLRRRRNLVRRQAHPEKRSLPTESSGEAQRLTFSLRFLIKDPPMKMSSISPSPGLAVAKAMARTMRKTNTKVYNVVRVIWAAWER